uniref:Uncharacterized protein n=1 Tax=Anopheles culicifacies TaxID=139723 RepID=A0A182LX87_9DIPT
MKDCRPAQQETPREEDEQHWRCGVRDAKERFDGFEKFVSVQWQHQPLQPAVPRLHNPVAEARVFIQIHRGTVQEAHQQEINYAEGHTYGRVLFCTNAHCPHGCCLQPFDFEDTITPRSAQGQKKLLQIVRQ